MNKFLLLILSVVLFSVSSVPAQIFTDDFETGTIGPEWGIYFAGEDTLLAVPSDYAPEILANGGNYCAYLQDWDGSNSGAALSLAGDYNLQDYSMEAYVYCYVNHPGGFSAYTGVVVYADDNVGTYIKMVADFDSDSRIRLYNNHLDFGTGEYSFEHSFTAADFPSGVPTSDGWHIFKVIVKTLNADTTAFWCYFDDEELLGCPIYDTSDDRMSSGKFGLFSFQMDQDGLEGFFDNVTVASAVTSVEDNNEDIPASFLLEQNYPNPFNPSTKIRFSVSQSEFVTLKIFDVMGREVASLVNEEKAAGNYEYEFSAENLSSGIYFYKLIAGNFTATKKMILIR